MINGPVEEIVTAEYLRAVAKVSVGLIPNFSAIYKETFGPSRAVFTLTSLCVCGTCNVEDAVLWLMIN